MILNISYYLVSTKIGQNLKNNSKKLQTFRKIYIYKQHCCNIKTSVTLFAIKILNEINVSDYFFFLKSN